MGKWLVGCTVVLLLVLGFVVLLGTVVYREVRHIGDSFEGASAKFEEISKLYPFTPPSDGVMDEAGFVRFLEARRAVADEARKFLEEIRRGSVIRRISTGLKAFRAIAPAVAGALESAKMPLEAYRFFATETMYVLRASAREDLAARYPALAAARAAHERLVASTDEIQTSGGWRFVFRIDPRRLVVPERNLEIVARHADEVAATADAVLVEDFLAERGGLGEGADDAPAGE